jgi:hypothetical protein
LAVCRRIRFGEHHFWWCAWDGLCESSYVVVWWCGGARPLMMMV